MEPAPNFCPRLPPPQHRRGLLLHLPPPRKAMPPPSSSPASLRVRPPPSSPTSPSIFFCYFDPFAKLFSIVNRSENYFQIWPMNDTSIKLALNVTSNTPQNNWRGCPIVECLPAMLTGSRSDVAHWFRANCPGAGRLPRNGSISRMLVGLVGRSP